MLINQNSQVAFSMRDWGLLNLEKQSSSQILIRSSNFEVSNTGPQHKESIDQNESNLVRQAIYDLEDEDNMAHGGLMNEDVADYFLKIFLKQSANSTSVIVDLGKLEIEITEHVVKRVTETLLQDFP